MPSIITVPVDPMASKGQHIDAALARCDDEYIAIVPNEFPIKKTWIENPLYALINSSTNRLGFESEDSTDKLWAAVFKKNDLQYARKGFPDLPVRQSLKAAGITLRKPNFEELPFQFDHLLREAHLAEKDGNWAKAASLFEYIAEHHQNELWMKELASKAFFKAGGYTKAATLSNEVNQQQPTVDTLLLEAKINREKKNYDSAIQLLEKAEQVLRFPLCNTLPNEGALEGKELIWT